MNKPYAHAYTFAVYDNELKLKARIIATTSEKALVAAKKRFAAPIIENLDLPGVRTYADH